MNERSGKLAGTIRTALIGYGIACCTYLLNREGLGGARAYGVDASAIALAASGLGLQVAILLARAAVRRCFADAELAMRANALIDLLGDAVTVFLFAMATLGALTHATDEL